MYTNSSKLPKFKKLARKNLNIYNLYFFTFFFALGTYLPLFPLYMREIALFGDDKIGIILSFSPLISILFQPLWGIINDKLHLDKKIVYMGLIMLNVTIAITLLTKDFYVIALFTLLYGLFGCGIGPIQDSLTVLYTRKYGFKYGDVRIWGSIGYAVATLITGYLVRSSGYHVIIVLSTIFFIIALFSFFKIKQVRVLRLDKNIKRPNNLVLVLKNKIFIIFLIFAALSIGVFSAAVNFMVLYINDLGGTTSEIGLLTSITVFIEILTMLYVIKVNNSISDFKLIVTSILIQVPIFLIFILSDHLYLLLFVLALRGVSTGLFVPVVVNFISSLLPSDQMASGIILYSALSINFTGYLTTIISGFISTGYDYPTLFIIVLISILLSLFFGILLNRVKGQFVEKL